MSDRQIAGALFLSPRGGYATKLLTKLNLDSGRLRTLPGRPGRRDDRRDRRVARGCRLPARRGHLPGGHRLTTIRGIPHAPAPAGMPAGAGVLNAWALPFGLRL